MSIEEILDHSQFLNPHTKLDFNSHNPFFYCMPPNNISDKFTTIRDICRFLQPGFISSKWFEEELNLPPANHNQIYKAILELLPNDWIYLLKNKTCQESLLKVFYFNKRDARKVKNLKIFSVPKKGYFQTRLRENLHIWNGTKKENFDGLFYHFLGKNTHNFVKSDVKFENKCLFHAKFYEAWHEKKIGSQSCEIWGLRP